MYLYRNTPPSTARLDTRLLRDATQSLEASAATLSSRKVCAVETNAICAESRFSAEEYPRRFATSAIARLCASPRSRWTPFPIDFFFFFSFVAYKNSPKLQSEFKFFFPPLFVSRLSSVAPRASSPFESKREERKKFYPLPPARPAQKRSTSEVSFRSFPLGTGRAKRAPGNPPGSDRVGAP